MEHKEDEAEESLLFALKEDSMGERRIWYINNGASNHMTGDNSKFVELDTSKKGYISFGDNTKVEINGKGVILTGARDGSRIVLHDVYYIPKLTSNIVRIVQLLERGYKIHMKDCKLWLRVSDSNLVAKVTLSKNVCSC